MSLNISTHFSVVLVVRTKSTYLEDVLRAVLNACKTQGRGDRGFTQWLRCMFLGEVLVQGKEDQDFFSPRKMEKETQIFLIILK